MTYTSLWVLSRILLFMCIVQFELGPCCMTVCAERSMRGLDIREGVGVSTLTMDGQRWRDSRCAIKGTAL